MSDKRKEAILKNRVDGSADRAGAMAVELHRARKPKPTAEVREEAVEKGKPDNDAVEKSAAGRAANLGAYHHPPKRK